MINTIIKNNTITLTVVHVLSGDGVVGMSLNLLRLKSDDATDGKSNTT